MRRLSILALSLALAAACGTDGDEATPTTTAAKAAESPTTTTTAGEPGTVVEVVVKSGALVGGVQRVEVDAGDEVILRVTSDVADEVHLHGYDVTVDVEAGGTVDLTFTADIPGVFAAELEDAGLKLVEFEVRP